MKLVDRNRRGVESACVLALGFVPISFATILSSEPIRTMSRAMIRQRPPMRNGHHCSSTNCRLNSSHDITRWAPLLTEDSFRTPTTTRSAGSAFSADLSLVSTKSDTAPVKPQRTLDYRDTPPALPCRVELTSPVVVQQHVHREKDCSFPIKFVLLPAEGTTP